MPSPTRPKIPCQRCHGTKVQPLSNSLWEMLLAVRKRGEATVAELNKDMKNGEEQHPTCTYKRLERLLELKLIEKISGRERGSKFNPTKFREVKVG